MKKMLIRLMLLVIISAFSQMSVYSQINCPPEEGIGCGPWLIGVYNTDTDKPSCKLRVQYRWRNCNGSYQVYIDDVRKTGNCEYLGEGADMQSFQEWLDFVLIEEISNLAGQYLPPNCPQTTQKITFYTATCGLWVKCEYTVDETTRLCQDDWRGEYPDQVIEGQRKISVWKWQSCGVTCCKKVYEICLTQELSKPGNVEIKIMGVTKEQVGECSNPQGFVQPCQSGC